MIEAKAMMAKNMDPKYTMIPPDSLCMNKSIADTSPEEGPETPPELIIWSILAATISEENIHDTMNIMINNAYNPMIKRLLSPRDSINMFLNDSIIVMIIVILKTSNYIYN